MEKQKVIEQMIDLHKMFFENYFSMMVMLQDQTEKILKPFVDNAPGISDEAKKVIDQWTSEYKKSRDNFKEAIDNGYKKVEEFFDYNAMLKFQEQNEKMFSTFLNQANWMPKDFQKATEELTTTYKKGCDNFKKYVDQNINHMEDFFSPGEKKGKKARRQK